VSKQSFPGVSSRCGGGVLSISVLGPVAWEDRSTGRCTDAGAGNLPTSVRRKAQDISVRRLLRKEMKLRLVVASELC
jgi:hypothetical protein